jgi:peptidoglycan/LPS O-acetylase OafA/YrhL
MAAAPFLGVELTILNNNILWSLAAELVYYSLYPTLLALRRAGVTWRHMIAVTFLIAFALAASNPAAKDYPSWGLGLNWILGLPCWLLGCELAERTIAGRLPSRGSLWRWRGIVWAGSVVASGLRYHSPIGFPWTLNLFAFPVAFWLALEIRHFQSAAEPTPWLEWSGKWSYSVYLIHLPAAALFALLKFPNVGYLMNWALLTSAVIGASYAFYIAVEYPGHIAARTLGRALQRGEGRAALAAPSAAGPSASAVASAPGSSDPPQVADLAVTGPELS